MRGRGLRPGPRQGAHTLLSLRPQWQHGGLPSDPGSQKHLACIQGGPTVSHRQPLQSTGFCRLLGTAPRLRGRLSRCGTPLLQAVPGEERAARLSHPPFRLAVETSRKVGEFVWPPLSTHPLLPLSFLLSCVVLPVAPRADVGGCANDPALWQGGLAASTRPTPSLPPPLLGKARRQGFINEPLLPGGMRSGSSGLELMRGV